MRNLEIIDLYDKSNENKNDTFAQNVNSSLRVVTHYDETSTDFEWLDIMEDSIRYLDNILRNPNRFIVDEEDVVKVELAKKITVESIKHLSKNTNLIQDIDKKTGDVRPSKILNVNKEESFNTYENRFIYSLIKNMRFYIDKKKKGITGDVASSVKNTKRMEYNASSKMGAEDVNISMSIDSKLNKNNKEKGKSDLSIAERIEKLELQISDLTCSQVYQDIDKLHISLVTSPIKKTNVILKNVNFQYAVKLWNYMQEHFDDGTSRRKKNQDYQDDGKLKKIIDESFLLDYLVLDTLNSKKENKQTNDEISEKIVENMLEKIMSLDPSIDLEKLKNWVGKQYSVVKYKVVVNEQQIEKLFRKYIDKYLDQIEEVKI